MGAQGEDKVEETVSAEVPNWSLEKPRRFWDPGRRLLRSIRLYQYWRTRRGLVSACLCKLLVLNHRFWSVITGADIPLNCSLGGGLLLPHPNGVVIHPDAKIGVNCLIFQQVTIGSRGKHGVPIIAGHVEIGAGAKILGPVRVGAHAKIGANAVVSTDVPSKAIAIGVPARIID
jgi:serine O-acetyltransferase